MEANKVFWIKVKDSETMLKVISDGIVPLMHEYNIFDYGKADSYHYSEFFDNKKSFWFSISNVDFGFDVIKILCDEFSTPAICCYENKFYGYDSLGEIIDLPESYQDDYEMAATYIEEITGYDFDSYMYYGINPNEYLENNKKSKWDVYDMEDDLYFNDLLIEDNDNSKENEKYKETFFSPNPAYFLKEEKVKHEESINETLKVLNTIENKEKDTMSKSTKVLKFKEPVVIDNEDNFINDSNYSAENNSNKNLSSDKSKSIIDDSLSSLSAKLEPINLPNEEERNLEKIELSDEDVNIDELSSLLNSLDEAFIHKSDDSITDDIESEAIDETSNENDELGESEIEISQEELDEIIKSYEQQDNTNSASKIDTESFEFDNEPDVDPDYLIDEIDVQSDDCNINNSCNENFVYSTNFEKVKETNLSYLENAPRKHREFNFQKLDDIRDEILEPEEMDKKLLDLELESNPIDTEFDDIQGLENIKDNKSEKDVVEMSKNVSTIDLDENDAGKCGCACNCDLNDSSKEVCTTTKCDCGCTIENCDCNEFDCTCTKDENRKCDCISCTCDLEDETWEKICSAECNCGCGNGECKCELDCICIKNDDEKCQCAFNYSDTCAIKCDCGCGIDKCKCNEYDCTCMEDENLEKMFSTKCDCGCDVDECKCDMLESSCMIEDSEKTCPIECNCEFRDSDEIKEFECCKFDNVEENVTKDKSKHQEIEENKYETLFDECKCNLEASEEVEDKCFENCGCNKDWEDKVELQEESCEVCDSLKNKETVAQTISENNWETADIDLSSINNFEPAQDLLTEKVDLNFGFDETKDEEIVDKSIQEVKDQEFNDFYVPFHIEDNDTLMNIDSDENKEIIDDKSNLEEIKLADDFEFIKDVNLEDVQVFEDKEYNIDENLGLDLNEIKVTNQEPIWDDSLELDLSDSTTEKTTSNFVDASINFASTLVDENLVKTKSSKNIPYIQTDFDDEATLNKSLDEAKNSLKSNKNLAKELQKFLDELNIERKKLAEKKLIISKRNEEAKRLFFSSFGKIGNKNLK